MMQTGNSQWDCRAPACFWLCVKCVSLDTSSIPPEINPWAPHPLNPLPLQSLHPPCLLKCVSVWVWTCVCVCLCLRWAVVRGPCTRGTCRGATEKTAVCLRETEKREEESVEGRQACQSRPSLLEWVPPSLLLSFFSSVKLSCFFASSLSTCLLLIFNTVFIASFCCYL